MKAITLISVTALLTLFCQAFSNVPPDEAKTLSGRVDRDAIIAAANGAIHKYMKMGEQGRKSNEIPKKFWGDAIARLNPIRVLNDRLNVFIVLKEMELTVEGLYVSIPISSYAPGHDERFLQFRELTQPNDKSFGELYLCKLKKPNKMQK